MKVLVLTLLCVALSVAVPVDMESSDNTQLTLADYEIEPIDDENTQEVARSKRFILKKIALAKAGALGIGALGLAGAAVAAKGAIGGVFTGGAGGPHSTPSQQYGYGYNNYHSAPSYTTGYPSAGYYSSQSVVPSTYTANYNTDTTYGSGVVASGGVGFAPPNYALQNQIQPYAFRNAGPLPQKAVYVVCDQQ